MRYIRRWRAFSAGSRRAFLHPVQCNIYLTPPGAQDFPLHYDTHNILILQVQGEKLWRYWQHTAGAVCEQPDTRGKTRSAPPRRNRLHPDDAAG